MEYYLPSTSSSSDQDGTEETVEPFVGNGFNAIREEEEEAAENDADGNRERKSGGSRKRRRKPEAKDIVRMVVTSPLGHGMEDNLDETAPLPSAGHRHLLGRPDSEPSAAPSLPFPSADAIEAFFRRGGAVGTDALPPQAQGAAPSSAASLNFGLFTLNGGSSTGGSDGGTGEEEKKPEGTEGEEDADKKREKGDIVGSSPLFGGAHPSALKVSGSLSPSGASSAASSLHGSVSPAASGKASQGPSFQFPGRRSGTEESDRMPELSGAIATDKRIRRCKFELSDARL
uniref:SIT4 phosphatase-associated protein n=1 Tax=Globodera pallida TaxID=36090 RepID=A0A183C5P6_GLOPA